MSEHPSLAEQAKQFAEELTDTVYAVSPDCSAFTAQAVEDGGRFVVRQSPSVGVPLRVHGSPLLSLLVDYKCSLDGEQKYLAIEQSKITVYAGPKAGGEPLFRYEYERKAEGIPSAHIHVHAHRDALSHVLAGAGDGTKRGRRRANASNIPALRELHFPVGGHRFRPCLEDVLEMLIDEFGIDPVPDSALALHNGRERWRRTQTKSVIRDDPESAVATLRELGYTVEFPADQPVPEVKHNRLRSR